jgi:hypothetical protein
MQKCEFLEDLFNAIYMVVEIVHLKSTSMIPRIYI